MQHLRSIGKVVYLDISYDEMVRRIGNIVDRGVAIPEGYTLKDLYDERTRLYESMRISASTSAAKAWDRSWMSCAGSSQHSIRMN